jgi:hypothetical protein
MSLLLPADLEPVGLEPLYLGSSYPLDHEFLVWRIILILEFPDELWGRGILTENYLIPSWFRTADPWITVPWSYPLDHEGFVMRKILELPDIVCGREI